MEKLTRFLDLSQYTGEELIIFGIGLVFSLSVFTIIWKKARSMGYLIIFALIVFILYHGVDWDYWRWYFQLQPKGRL